MEPIVPPPSEHGSKPATPSQSGGDRKPPGSPSARSAQGGKGAPRAASLEGRAVLAYQYACQGRLYDLTKILEGGAGLSDAKTLLRWRLEPEYQRTLLMGAASAGEGAVAKYLLLLLLLVTADSDGDGDGDGEHGVAKAVNEQDETGATALVLACMGGGGEEEGEGGEALVEALLEAGADPLLLDNEGYSALHMASAFGRVEACRLLLDHVASPSQLTTLVNGVNGTETESPLWLAVKEQHTGVAALLLGKGATVNAQVEALVRVRGLRRQGPEGAQVMAKLLLGHTHVNTQGHTQGQGQDEALDSSSDEDGYGSGEGDDESWEGSDSDSSQDQDQQGARAVKAFHHVCGVGAVADVKWLLQQHGCSVLLHAKDPTRLGMTPLHRAAEAGQQHVVCELLSWGADVEALDEHGASPLCVAAMEGHAHVAQALLTHGHAHVDSRDQDGDTPAMVASCCGWTEVLQVLLQGGADVRAVTQGAGSQSKQWTPLHYAARHGEDGAARLLVDRGAEVGVRDEKGRTPADLACLYGHTTLGHWLEAQQQQQQHKGLGLGLGEEGQDRDDVVTPRDVMLHVHSESDGSVSVLE